MAAKVFTFVFAVLGLTLLFACSVQPTPVEHVDAPKAPEFAKALPEGCKLGRGIKVDGAVIYAVLDASAPSDTEFLTLDEAMAKNLCTVKEVGEGGTVNTLKISNSGSKPIFCMAGDLVLGGQQDRVLAESLVVAPDTRDQDIPVFCVEHGRWSPQEKDGVHAKSRTFTNNENCGQVDLNVKKAALEHRNQSMVWEEVARNNTKMRVSAKTESGTFRATYDDEDTRTKIEKNFSAAQKLVGTGVVGFAVVCDGELVAMDVFESSGLCAKLANKLLRSYVITGIGGGYESADFTAQPSTGAAGRVVFGTTQTQTLELRLGNENSSGVQIESNTAGIAPASPSGGIFFSNQTPNTNTETKREYTKEAVKYDCTDKKSGKVVQRSFMKR